MKKQILIMLLMLSTIRVFAQFNVSLTGGYAFGVNKIYSNQISGSYATTSYLKKISFGQGFSPTFRLGYQFSNNFNIGCSFSYLISNKQVYTNFSTIEKEDYHFRLASSNALFISPDVRYHFNAWLYGGIGLIYCPTQTSKTQEDYNFSFGQNITVCKTEYTETSKNNFGNRIFLGYNYKMNDKLALVAELNYSIINMKPTKGDYTKYNLNGVDKMVDLEYYILHWEYVNKTDNSIITRDYTKAEKRFYSNDNVKAFSSLGIQIGVCYKL